MSLWWMGDRQPLLVVDDEPVVQSAILEMLRNSRFAPEFASSAAEALANLKCERIHAVLSDVRMPGRSGIDLVREAQQIRPDIRVLLMTGYASVDSAIQSIRAGAFDYITKPFKRKQLLSALERAFQIETTRSNKRNVRAQVPVRFCGSSPAICTIMRLIDKIASSRSNVLITGETGTGKELVARMIHNAAMPPDAPLVPIDCAAIPIGLLESELFGHVRGAFTGAVKSKRGLFEIANRGTVFLDEISEMPLDLQTKLLRVLQEREIRRVGGTEAIKIDVRIIAATNKDLKEEVMKRSFRGDLFYRLNVIPIHIPPLRARREDIREIAEYFVTLKSPSETPQISPAALKLLEELPWEGNVRELENTIELALALGNGETMLPSDLTIGDPCKPSETADSDFLFQSLANQRVPLHEIEDRVIAAALRVANGNKVKAAQALGISRRTLYRRGLTVRPVETDAEPMQDDPDRSELYPFNS